MDMAGVAHGALASLLLVALAGCGASDATPNAGCVAQVSATYDFVVLARTVSGELWAAPSSTASFARIMGTDGALLASDMAASGSSAYGNAIGCAVVDGNVWCFPLAGPLIDSSQLGAGLGAERSDGARRVIGSEDSPLIGVVQIAGGMNGAGASFCALTSNGRIWCWGYNPSGLLGYDDDTNVARTVMQEGNTPLDGAVEVRVGFESTCARKSDGSVWCWGSNAYGALGHPPLAADERSTLPVQVALPEAAQGLTKSPGHTQCALLEHGHVTCWGRNEYAQAGADSRAQSVGPTTILDSLDGAPLQGIVDLAPDRGMRAMCGSGAEGLWCWGDIDPENRDGSPRPVLLRPGRVEAPLTAYGARDGSLIYLDENRRIVFRADGIPATRQVECSSMRVVPRY